VPGIGDIPLLGKLFQSKSVTRSHTELLVIITPEIVGPIPGGQPVPEIRFRNPFLPASTDTTLAQPATGAPPLRPSLDSVPIELLTQPPKKAAPPAK